LVRTTSKLLDVNDELFNSTIRHSAQLERLKTGEANRVARVLDDALGDLLGKLRGRLRRIKTRGFDTGVQSTQALRELGGVIDTQLRTTLRAVSSSTAKNLNQLAISESKWAKATVENAFPVNIALKGPDPTLLKAIVRNNPFEGRILKQWYTDLSVSGRKSARAALTRGLVQGETVQQISARLRGALNITKRHATTITRTAVNHVTTQAREITFQENSDVIKSVRYVATLDARTTDICASLDGQEFPLGEGPRPPMHHQCRSTTVPITKSWKELGIDGLGEVKAGTRPTNKITGAERRRISRLPSKEKAALRTQLSGQVPATTTYNQWLKRQPVAVQNEALGVRRARLFRKGQVTHVRDLVDQTGRSLRLDELERFNEVQQGPPPPPIKFASIEIPSREIDSLLDELVDMADKAKRKTIQGKIKALVGSDVRTGMFNPKYPDPRQFPRIPSKSTPAQKQLLRELQGVTDVAQREIIVRKLRETGFNGDTRGWRPKGSKVKPPRPRPKTTDVEKVIREAEEATVASREVTTVLRGSEVRQRLVQANKELQSKIDRLIVERDTLSDKLWREAVDRGSFEHVNHRKALQPIERAISKARKELKKRSLELLRVNDPISAEWAGGGARISKKLEKKLDRALEFVRNITSRRAFGEKTIRYNVRLQSRGRPFHEYQGRSLSSLMLKSYDPESLIAHEIAHGVEVHSGILRKAVSFLGKRAGSEKIRKLSAITGNSRYDATEFAWKDKFINPYMGKDYEGRATELISMGVEYLNKDPLTLARRDPEYFDWLVDVLRGHV